MMWLRRVTWTQWALVGSLALVLLIVDWIGTPGTAWQSISGLSFSPDGQQLAIGIFSGRFRRAGTQWHFADVGSTFALAAPASSEPPSILERSEVGGVLNMMPEVYIGPAVGFSADGKRLASAGYEGELKVWDVTTHRQVDAFSTKRMHIRAVTPIPGRNLVATTFRYWLSLWNVDDESCPASVETAINIQSVAISADGKLAALGALGPFQIELWDLDKKKRIARIETKEESAFGIRSLAFTPDGKSLIAAYDQAVEFVDVATRKITGAIPERMVLALAISPDGRQLATGRYDGVKIWDLATRGKTSFDQKVPSVESVQFSPDNEKLAAGSTDGTVRIWDAKTGELAWSREFPGRIHQDTLKSLKIALLGLWTMAFLWYFRRFLWERVLVRLWLNRTRMPVGIRHS